MNLGDPELELIDPTPNVHTLFIHFDKLFFWDKLYSRAVVRWSKRMYSCAGVCSYEGRGGLCDIALSEPLLKLRPRKDLIETLLHEMIHAFLFVTNRDQDRDGHGPNFKAHMHRINKSAGLNISIYHSFHDEVEMYQTHWWRCNGPCQTRRPHFGIVRRSMNRAPGPSDYWWKDHLKRCGGTFVKIKEPEKQNTKGTKNTSVIRPNGDITKYITNNIKTINNVTDTCDNGNNSIKPILKDSSNIKVNTKSKSNNSSTLVITKKGVVFNPTTPRRASQPIAVFTGKGHTINEGKCGSSSMHVTETVRSIWANKQIPSNKELVNNVQTSPLVKKPATSLQTNSSKDLTSKVAVSNPNKHKAESDNLNSPPTKLKKIDDYFKATSLLKDLYGEDFKLTQSDDNVKLVAVSIKGELVDCPICCTKFSNDEINRHLDECLNRDIIDKLSKDGIESIQEVKPRPSNVDKTNIRDTIGVIPPIPAFSGKPSSLNNNTVDLTNYNINDIYVHTNNRKRKIESQTSLQINNIEEVISRTKEICEVFATQGTEMVKSNNAKRRNTIGSIIPSREDNMPIEVKIDTDDVKIKPEAGTSADKVFNQSCPCCGQKFDKPVEEHLDECLVFFSNNTTIPEEGASTSYSNNSTIVIDDDDDDVLDETQTMNATGTKTPCPCCMKMVETDDMNAHLDLCLQ